MKIKNIFPLSVFLVAMLACGTLGVPTSEPIAPPIFTQPIPTNALTFTAIPTFTPVASTDISPAPLLSQIITMQTSPFEESGSAPVYTITAQIPSLQGSDDPRVSTFNARLLQIAQDQINQFRSDVLSFASNPPISAGSFFDMQYSVIGQRGDVWSIKFDISFYSDGAAHPAHYSTTLNYDLEAAREVALSELFLPGSNYLEVISEYCKEQLSIRDIAFDGFSQGADPLAENFGRWNLSNAGLLITFDEYQVAPYAAGPQVVVIPYPELQGIIASPGVLDVFVQ